MSIPKKGSRKINVNGTEYRWSIRKKPSYGQAINESNLTAAVELYDNPCSTLIITFPFLRPDSWISPSKKQVTPSDIKDLIEKALSKGWTPALNGKTFDLTLSK